MVDSLEVTTRWLASGAGRGEATVTQGDARRGDSGVGLHAGGVLGYEFPGDL